MVITGVVTSAPARAIPGELDPTFGSQGRVTTAFEIHGFSDDEGEELLLQPDGKVVVVGTSFYALPNPPGGGGSSFILARYLGNGALDASFGVAGRISYEAGSTNSRAAAAVLQPDGRILVVGIAWVGIAEDYWDVAIARFLPDGSLDGAFGDGGIVTTDFAAGSDFAEAVALQPDGKIVVAGSAETVPGNFISRDFVVARYLVDGTPDSSFGDGGYVTTSLGGNDGAGTVAVQSDGKILAAGGRLGGDFSLVRYQPDGSLDPTFGTGGTVLTDFGGEDYVTSVVLQPDGRILAAGSSWTGGGSFTFDLARYSNTGILDPSFGAGGKVVTTFGGGNDAARAVALQPDGRIVAGGRAGSSSISSLDFAVARFEPDGTLDRSFGIGGRITTDFVGDADTVSDIVVQPDGKIVAAGTRLDQRGEDFAMVRYLGTGEPAMTPVPSISSFAPTSGPPGTAVAIVGSNFAGANSVRFNGTVQPSYTVDPTGTLITTRVPSGATSGPILVTTPTGVAVSAGRFTVVVQPTAHARNVTFRMGGHLRAHGRIVVEDSFAPCAEGRKVRIQRSHEGAWRTIDSDVTDAAGRYSVGLPDRAGWYRAMIRQATLEDGAVCNEATSGTRHHTI
jgi:uncharacterized delta-60 repeat protein